MFALGSGVASGNFGGTGYGYGMINNAGVTTTFDQHLSFNAEIANPIVYINNSNQASHYTSFYLVPSLSMSYRF
jgi:hypothetical protein